MTVKELTSAMEEPNLKLAESLKLEAIAAAAAEEAVRAELTKKLGQAEPAAAKRGKSADLFVFEVARSPLRPVPSVTAANSVSHGPLGPMAGNSRPADQPNHCLKCAFPCSAGLRPMAWTFGGNGAKIVETMFFLKNLGKIYDR